MRLSCGKCLFQINGSAKRRIIKEEKEDSGAEAVKEEDVGSSRENSIMSESVDGRKVCTA